MDPWWLRCLIFLVSTHHHHHHHVWEKKKYWRSTAEIGRRRSRWRRNCSMITLRMISWLTSLTEMSELSWSLKKNLVKLNILKDSFLILIIKGATFILWIITTNVQHIPSLLDCLDVLTYNDQLMMQWEQLKNNQTTIQLLREKILSAMMSSS